MYTVKLLLSDQLRDDQKAVAEEKGSPNAINCTILNRVTAYNML